MKTIHQIIIFTLSVAIGLCANAQVQPVSKEYKRNVWLKETPAEFKRYNDYPWEMLKDKEFGTLYKNAITGKKLPHWFRNLSGPSNRGSMCIVGDEVIFKYTSCMPHNCNTDEAVVLYFPFANFLTIRLYENYVNDLPTTHQQFGRSTQLANKIFTGQFCNSIEE